MPSFTDLLYLNVTSNIKLSSCNCQLFFPSCKILFHTGKGNVISKALKMKDTIKQDKPAGEQRQDVGGGSGGWGG